LLKQLSEAEGDILENVELIESLEEAKRLSAEISEKVEVAKETEVRINEARELYRPVANRGALLFFLLSELFKIHQFYHYSLASFLSVFLRAIDITGKTYFGPKFDAQTSLSKVSESTNSFYKMKCAVALLKAGQNNLINEGQYNEIDAADVDLDVRVPALIDSITFQVFGFTRRGLFERHKLLFATLTCLRVLVRMGTLDAKEVEYLVLNKKASNLPALSHEISQWCPESSWACIVALQDLPAFNKIASDIENHSKDWRAWTSEECPEKVDPPGEWKKLTEFQRLLLLRILRVDRVVNALTTFVRNSLGDRYIDEDPFDVVSTYKESSSKTPMFFYLFPGADVVKDIEPILKKKGFSIENKQFRNISMGQGQEPAAEQALDDYTEHGGWVFLQNIHLMSQWVKVLERKLEVANERAHPEFRCFLSAEPHPDPQAKIIPESIMQNSIKIANEPPQNIRANFLRAWSNFDQEFLDKSVDKAKELRSILFSLCFFHSIVLGRRKFGFQGWSRGYSFNVGDLTQCADVLYNQLSINEVVPWQDLRYIFGEIMYGGHITDFWDRRTNNTYLEVMMQPAMLEDANFTLAPNLKVTTEGTYADYNRVIGEGLPAESPALFGLHSNAEISYLANLADSIFRFALDIQGSGTSGGDGGSNQEDVVKDLLQDYLDQLPENFNMMEITGRVVEKTPHLVVMLQECDRMNGLLFEIRRSLREMKLGLEGALNISDAMEALSASLFYDRVPATWEKVAYPSLKPLGSWYNNLLERVEQLASWSDSLQTPPSLWISGLFNPMAFLTAVMQVTAREHSWPLDEVVIQTDVTSFQQEHVDSQPEEGAYIHGLFVEGARWDTSDGVLRSSLLKELHPPLPVLHVKACPTADKRKSGFYDCPVFYTIMRGGTYIFTAQLKTEDDLSKWVLAGVALLMSAE